MTRTLTPKQAAFVQEYLVDMDAARAAVRAGYSTGNAAARGLALLALPAVREALDRAQAERVARLERSAMDVLQDIRTVTRDALAGGDLKTALKGLELEGKHVGMFMDRLRAELSGPEGRAPVAGIQIRFVEPEHD